MTEPVRKETVAPQTAYQVSLTRLLQVAVDGSLMIVCFALAYLLRFDFALSTSAARTMLRLLPLVLAIEFLSLFVSGVYSFVWRYVGMREVTAFLRASLLSMIPMLLLRSLPVQSLQHWRIPFSITLINGMFFFVTILGARVLRRALYERFQQREATQEDHHAQPPVRVLLVGAGSAGVAAVRELQRGSNSITMVGFVDDSIEKVGSVIQGIRVLGTTRQLKTLIHRHHVEQVIITMAKAGRRVIRRVVSTSEECGVAVRIVPKFSEIVDGSVPASHLRNVQIEDLLGRDPVQLEEEQIHKITAGKTVMITGAGGSIGSELCRQVLRFRPAHLLLVERSEFALWQIHRELRSVSQNTQLHPVLADVGDGKRMENVFKETPPHVVLHAAAHKHVPLVELNPSEAVRNNALGTRTLAAIAGNHRVEVFVLVSTDKAVNPTSIMGCTKRLAELATQELNERYDTRYLAVRFGNVLGSAGSVVPIFKEQIARGGPVTVTHPDMMRYFMTIPEATQLVLQAGTMGQGGEIFILDMGEPVRILDLAKDMIRLSGLTPDEDIDVHFTGIRDGEKLFEELSTQGEGLTKTRHRKIFIGSIAPPDPAQLAAQFTALQAAVESQNVDKLRALVADAIPESRIGGKSASPASLSSSLAANSNHP